MYEVDYLGQIYLYLLQEGVDIKSWRKINVAWVTAQNLTDDNTCEEPVRSNHQSTSKTCWRDNGTAQSTNSEVNLNNRMPPRIDDSSWSHSHI